MTMGVAMQRSVPTWWVVVGLVLGGGAATAAGQVCCGAGDGGVPPGTGIAPGQDEAEDDDNEDKEEEDEKEKWDVSNPPGPSEEVRVDVREGTWMNLDVSPDGTHIVFDLLGDIYAIPIEGGDATALTSGPAWDVQPRYSPDGSRISFTSDRGGGDNVWIMKRDGSDPKAVTDEDYRLLNNAVWTPDGQYLAARKHFTSRRSIGSGEIWLYHSSGGEGVQMTTKPNDQKDVGEPAFSPDGRYLYFSQDVSPGDTFEYNRDPNGQIYQIKRLDRVTGDVEAFITGAGGSVRPTPSPDGRTIAFVRRVRTRSTLYLHDVASGKDRPIYDGLDRDMQETWAIHGVYPNMAWTPDSSSIVFWAGGAINRIDVATQEVSRIPFHVTATHRVTQALRFPVEVAPDGFDVKLLRWVQVSPDGKSVVFQALGHLYIRELPEGTPRRLTQQQDHFELYPSFSRDGRWIVYITWDDQALSTVRVVSLSGGEGRVVTPDPGHYVEPVISPDGRWIVYRRIGGGYLTSELWSRDPGVYRVPFDGGTPERITRNGANPRFGADGSRVFLIESERDDENDKVALTSIELDGSDHRRHLVSDNAYDIVLSHDEQWVAFAERYNVYICPFTRAGREIKIGPKSKALPTRQVSRDAGFWLHWSGDGRRLHWALGPELFTCELTDAFAFLEGAPAEKELPPPAAAGRNISFKTAYDKPPTRTALTGARLITLRGDEVIERGTLLVKDNRIEAVGGGDLEIPAGYERIDCAGRTIIPGLVDVHAHGGQGRSGFIPQQNWISYANLAFGVTTIHDPSHDSFTIFAAAELARTGAILAPRTYSTGTILYGASGGFRSIVNSLDDARSHVRRMKAMGAISVKSYNQPRRDQRQQVIAAAREYELMVVPEGGSLFQHNMSMILDGHTGIEHAIPVAAAYQDVMGLWSASGTGYTPTMVVGYGGIWGENYWYQHSNVWENERLLDFVPRFVVNPRSRRRMLIPEDDFNHFDVARTCKKLIDAGGRVQVGAHGQMAGLAAHWETWMLVQGGFTPLQALRAATLHGAAYVGLDADLGSLEPGKLADLVILGANPLENIRNTESVQRVMLNGRLYDAATMNEIGGGQRTRKPFFWEESES
ncbi:MAG: amidohydrolase [Phycisphaerales bacterium]|nr:MAG: amidohydrolase [Phycisphaerales bacterium]